MTKLLLALMVLMTSAQGIEVTGSWQIVQTTFNDDNGGQRKADCAFRQEGSKLSGKCFEDALVGEVAGSRVTWQMVVKYDNHTATIFYDGNLDEDGTSIRGGWRCPKQCENAAYKEGTFVVRRQP